MGGNQGAPVQCVATGACCTPGACSDTTEADCDAAGGTYLGDGEPCTSLEGGNDYVSNPGSPIPEFATVSDTINVPDSFIIDDLDVDFITDHTWVGDLTITVQSGAARGVRRCKLPPGLGEGAVRRHGRHGFHAPVLRREPTGGGHVVAGGTAARIVAPGDRNARRHRWRRRADANRLAGRLCGPMSDVDFGECGDEYA